MRYTQYKGGLSADTDRGPSPMIWADCPMDEIIATGKGHFFHDDFTFFSTFAASASEVDAYPYTVDNDTGVTILTLADTDYGAIQVANNDAANDGSTLMYGQEQGFARLGTTDTMWFECRVKKASVTDDALAFAIGLLEASTDDNASGLLVDTTGVIDASQDFVGFHCDPDDGDVIEPVYQEGGATAQQVGQGSTNAVGSGTDIAIAADTYQKLGMKFTGSGVGTGRQGLIEFFNNGTRVAYFPITASAAWPDTNHLMMVWGTKSVLTAASTMDMDWWRVATLAE